ncbi:hypothetical protein K4749_37670 [Streptomyces sp. TRM72054]|uniref:hypothetical protein n=1 Tax=Streptomyces sp. TRM72054 TaxID=2870562 RepID=UPI001C8B443E|nr:hypothetical protein [Streptomyces sp. TRM72054]MBX9399152.1 hypothetical protein [Streptomyces sp. TRM72054]
MSIQLTVAVISAVVALVSIVLSSRAARMQTILSAELERQSAELAREKKRHDIMSRFRDPLLWSAFDLQSRLYNIVTRNFLQTYGASKEAREREYARRSTLFVICEYLGWVEIIRRRIRFLDLGNRQDNRRLISLLAEISETLSTSAYLDRRFRVLRGEQRALGELMISRGGHAESCLGYAEFCNRLEVDTGFAKWTQGLTQDIETLIESPDLLQRITDLQCGLINLVNFLDPYAERIPETQRSLLRSSSKDAP